MRNLLAIIIPFYKLAFFEATLASLQNQTNKEFSVYIGDDASPEDCTFLLEKYKGKFDFKYHRFETNLGGKSLTQQWERCIALANDEEWFMILGDDDYLGENVVEEFYKYQEIIQQESINVIKLNSVIVDEHNKIKFEKKPEPLIKSSIDHFFDKYIIEGRSSLSEHIFRKDKFEKYGFVEMPFAWHSDDLALLEFSEYGNILFIENGVCCVRVFSESISGNPEKNKKEKWQASKIFFDRICQNLLCFNNEEKRKLFDLIEWHQKNKEIKIKIPFKLIEFCSAYGWKGILKVIKQ